MRRASSGRWRSHADSRWYAHPAGLHNAVHSCLQGVPGRDSHFSLIGGHHNRLTRLNYIANYFSKLEMGVSMDDRTFYERRLREELARATNEPDSVLKALHTGWASLYAERLTKLAHPLNRAA